jgi:uncharacterized lipoprotein YajG
MVTAVKILKEAKTMKKVSILLAVLLLASCSGTESPSPP